MLERTFHIHGDNIIECERFLTLLQDVFSTSPIYVRPNSFVCPKYLFQFNDTNYYFQFLPGFQGNTEKQYSKGRWNHNILDIIKSRGGPLREAADILLTEIINKHEKPLLAIEFCSALPAGNQAWQRSGRSYSYGMAHIPILYVVDIGGHELSNTRENKNTRLPSSAVTFSYVSYSEYVKTSVSQIFMCNYGTTSEIRNQFMSSFGDTALISFLSEYILLGAPKEETIKIIQDKQLNFILSNIPQKHQNKKFSKEQWSDFFNCIEANDSINDFLESHGLDNWNKKISIDTSDTLQKHLQLAQKLGKGITQTDLPFCFIPKNKILEYVAELKKIYGNKISPYHYQQLTQLSVPLVLCWIAGFKPKGDDSRPDRGLIPFCRMLLGPDVYIKSIIYGPATEKTLDNLSQAPIKLLLNGLWEAIFVGSDSILVDSKTSEDLSMLAWSKQHWHHKNFSFSSNPVAVSPYVFPYPINFSENDVDSLIHNFFKIYEQNNLVFESSCNPPGGDWSGVSFLDTKLHQEYRWLTLPRVSHSSYKRPDHVIQIFNNTSTYILSIESKSFPKNIEPNIGPRLTGYIADLFSSSCNASRNINDTTNWSNTPFSLTTHSITHASAIAFLSGSTEAITKAEEISNSDLSFTVVLQNQEEILQIKSLTALGTKILNILKSNINIFDSYNLQIKFIDS